MTRIIRARGRKRLGHAALVGVALATTSAVQATITIPTVTVANAGNAADTRVMNDGSSGYGQVNYAFSIGQYEVTASQYTAFLNAVAATDTYGLYNPAMASDEAGCQIIRSGSPGSYTYSVASDYANRPVNYVSWGDAARFSNWLANGQPTGTQTAGTTETGSYVLNGATTASALTAISRSASASWVITSENEWYKAAFYDPTTSSYYQYATSSNALPSNTLVDPDPGNNANYLDSQDNLTLGGPYYRTEAGAFENSDSPYGTFDQNGNVWEWNESSFLDIFRVMRGGSMGSYDVTLSASFRYIDLPDYEANTVGFRVASLAAVVTASHWNVDASGAWSLSTNWSSGVPNGTDHVATFAGAISAARNVTVDAPYTVGAIHFNNANTYTLVGSGTLTLDVSSGSASITVAGGSHVIAATLVLNDDLAITTATGSGLAVTGAMTASGRAITKAGAGSVQFENIRAAALAVNEGSVRISAKGSANNVAGTTVVASLSIASGAQLDLTNNSAVIDYTVVGTLVNDTRTQFQDGRLTSSSADATHRLGYGDNAVLGKGSFAGQTVDATSLLIKYTYVGDANLDGQVDITDLAALATAWQASGVWTSGDFDYSGFVDITDLAGLATNWQAGVAAPLAVTFEQALAAIGLAGVAAPEPAWVGAMLIAPIVMFRPVVRRPNQIRTHRWPSRAGGSGRC